MPEATALQRALDPHIEPDEEDLQCELFAPPITAEGQAKALKRGYTGIGRPPGSKNRRTSVTVDYILKRYGDPRIGLAEIGFANVHDIVALTGCKPFEALQEKRLALIGLLPYTAAKITPDVIDQRPIINLIMGVEPGAAATGAGTVVHVLDPAEFERVEAPDAEKPSAPDDGNSET